MYGEMEVINFVGGVGLMSRKFFRWNSCDGSRRYLTVWRDYQGEMVAIKERFRTHHSLPYEVFVFPTLLNGITIPLFFFFEEAYPSCLLR